ncbi:MAG: PIN domain-containing protein [Verrucomicrobia bacterium]|nr:PIN domain-containing protein [Verrucomicrobiota bacterium]
MAEALLDANVLVYAMSDAAGERAKREEARRLLETVDYGTSYQVLMETWVAATRKMKIPVAEEKVLAFLERVAAQPVAHGTPELWRAAVRLAARYGVHPYDAAILAAAKELGAAIVYSEDMADGQDYDGVKVINPFRQPS